MTRLREALHEVAESYPPLSPPPAGLFDRARKAETRRRVAAGLAAVFVLLALGYSTRLLPAAPTVAAGSAAVPAYFLEPPKWTADVRDAPIERATLAFVIDREPETLVLVGPGSAYRSYPIQAEGPSAWTPPFLLAPDGRSVMVTRDRETELLDLASGRSRTLTAGVPLAWSTDGSQAVLASLDDGELRVVRMPGGEVAWRVPVQRTEKLLAAAFSPDGISLAVQQGAMLSVHREGSTAWSQEVGARLYLAGPHAWTTDAAKIALSKLTSTTVFDLVDAATGRVVRQVPGKGSLNYVGEQGRTAGLPAIVAWRGEFPIVNVGNRSIMDLNRSYGTVMTAAEGTRELQLTAIGTDWQATDPDPPNPGPAMQRYRPVISLALPGLLAVLALTAAGVRYLRPLRRRRGRA